MISDAVAPAIDRPLGLLSALATRERI